MALSALGRHDEVLQEMRVALETDPHSAQGWLMKGEALFGKGDFGQAEAALEKARSLDPSNPKADQLLGQIGQARAQGIEEMPIEATGTKEYPARAAANVKWASAASISFADASFGGAEESAGSYEPTPPSSSRLPDNETAPGRIARATSDGEESTTVDPDPEEAAWSSAPDTKPTMAPPVSSAPPPAPARLAPVAPPPARGAPVAPPQDNMPVTVLAPARAERGAAGASPAHVAGPDEATMFGAPRAVETPPTMRAVETPETMRAVETPEAVRAVQTPEAMSAIDASPPPSAIGRTTRELDAADDDPLDRGRPAVAQLPSGAHTMLAQRDAILPRGGQSATVDASPRARHAAVDLRRRDQETLEQSALDDRVAPRRRVVVEDSVDVPPSRVTKQVDALRRDEEEAFDGLASRPISDPSISLSEDEIVFAPPTGEEVGLRPEPPRAASVEEPVEDASLVASRDNLFQRARRWQERARAAEPGRPAAPPVQFIAPVPLEGVVADRGPPRREDLHPRITGAVEPLRGKKPSHLAHAVDAIAPLAPEAPRRRPELRPIIDPRLAAPHRPRAPAGVLTRALEILQLTPGRGPRNWLVLGGIVVAVVATGVVAGLLVREWRLRVRVERRHELAAKKTTSGNFPGFQAAELLYRQILAERDDRRAMALRAKVLAQLAFEFGEATEPAQRAVQALGTGSMPEEREARIYVALAKGELELAARLASALLKDKPGPHARYLMGQVHLLLDQPDDAATALRTAAAEDPQNPLVLHALGLAETALRQNDRAFDAYGKALTANANHVATIIDRALLQLRQGLDREAAAGSLEGVVGKLVGDASPGQLARAYVGLAEIELGKGNVAAARTALSSAAARRRDHPLLLEELAKAYADAFELDQAEHNAQRALAVSNRLAPKLILADVALRRSRPVQALTVLEETGSSRPDVLVLRALAKLELGRNAPARADAEQAMRIEPAHVGAAVAYARVDIAEGKYDAALRRLEDLEQRGKYAEVAWALGQVYLARRQPDRARTCFREALHRQPLLLQARLALARVHHDAGQLSEAREEVNRILGTNAAYVPARRELASLALDLGDAIAARDEFDALAERDADLDTLLGGARARLLLGDARGAEERIERALRMRPTGVDLEATQCLKARALLADHRANEAIQLLLKVVPTQLRGEPIALLIEAYLDYGRPDWAERAINLAPVATRTGIELTLAKARLALEQARQAAGKALAEEALARLRSGRAPVWLRAQALGLVGRAEFEMGNARAAWKSLSAALELDPRNVRVHHVLGQAALDLKRPQDAVRAFEGALANDPRFAEAQFYLGRTRRELADPRADESLRAYLELEPRGALADEARRLLRGEPITPTSDPPRSRRQGR